MDKQFLCFLVCFGLQSWWYSMGWRWVSSLPPQLLFANNFYFYTSINYVIKPFCVLQVFSMFLLYSFLNSKVQFGPPQFSYGPIQRQNIIFKSVPRILYRVQISPSIIIAEGLVCPPYENLRVNLNIFFVKDWRPVWINNLFATYSTSDYHGKRLYLHKLFL